MTWPASLDEVNWWAVALLAYCLVVLPFATRELLIQMRRLGKPEQ